MSHAATSGDPTGDVLAQMKAMLAKMEQDRKADRARLRRLEDALVERAGEDRRAREKERQDRDRADAEIRRLATELARQAFPPRPPSTTPSGSSSLPSSMPVNEWRRATELRRSGSGHVVMPGFGVRHMSDLEFSPSRDCFPTCWVKVKDEVAAIADEVVEEEILYPHRTAQSDWRRFLTDMNAKATQKGVAKKKTAMFLADRSTKFPFCGKALEANLKRWRERKDKRPALKEAESLSLLCPTDRSEWKHCDHTFRAEKLEPTVAQKQFGVSLPSLPDNLLKEESLMSVRKRRQSDCAVR